MNDLRERMSYTNLQVMQPVRTFLLPLRPEALGGVCDGTEYMRSTSKIICLRADVQLQLLRKSPRSRVRAKEMKGASWVNAVPLFAWVPAVIVGA